MYLNLNACNKWFQLTMSIETEISILDRAWDLSLSRGQTDKTDCYKPHRRKQPLA